MFRPFQSMRYPLVAPVWGTDRERTAEVPGSTGMSTPPTLSDVPRSSAAETVLDVHRNGAPIGTITFGTGASTGSFATAGGGAETFAAGDRLAIINEDPADATLADLSITFLGKRT